MIHTLQSTLTISPETRAFLSQGRDYCQLLCAAPPSEGITKVEGLDGALCYDTGIPGKSAAIVLGTHMNELAGFTAAADFHRRWQEGFRPPSGKVYVMVGGHIPTITDTFERLLQEPPAISESEFLAARTRILPQADAPLPASFNHNMIPLKFRDTPEKMTAENPLYERVQKIHALLSKCDAGVLDMHTTSQPSEPTASPFAHLGDDEAAVLAKLAPVTRDMPLKFITLFQEHNLLTYQPGDSAYARTELPLRAFAAVPEGAISLLVESGQHLDAKAFSNAVGMQQAWLRNVVQMPCHSASKSTTEKPVILENIHKIFHPNVLKGPARETVPAEALHDHYFLIHNTRQLEGDPAEGMHWSDAAKEKIAQYREQHLFGERQEERLGFYAPVKKGDVMAIGLNTGHAVTAQSDGFVLLVNKNPDLNREDDAFGYMGTQRSLNIQHAKPQHSL